MNIRGMVVLVLGFAVVAQAQQSDRAQVPAPQRQQGRDGAVVPGGERVPRGPFDAWPAGQPRPGNSTPINLANISHVQAELNLTVEQIQSLHELTKKLSEQQMQLFNERTSRAQMLNQEADRAVQQLLDPKQLARIEQLRLQQEGPTALLGLDVAEKLGISDEQRTKLAKLRDDLLSDELQNAARLAESFSRGGRGMGLSGGPDRRGSSGRILAEMVSVLTPEQMTKWEEMQGSRLAMFGTSPSFGPTERTRASEFVLGQYSLSSMSQVAATYGPAGPFRYQSTVEALALSEDQKTQIKIIGAEDDAAIRRIADPRGPDSFQEIAQINKATRDKLAKVLTADQNAKLKELTSATATVRSRTRSSGGRFELGQRPTGPPGSIVEELSGPAGPFRYKSTLVALAPLSDDQKTEIQIIGAEDEEAIRKIAAEQAPDMSDRMAQITKATREKLDKVLTEEQKAKLTELTDSSSSFSSSRRGFGGRTFEVGQYSLGSSLRAAEDQYGPAGPYRYKPAVEQLALSDVQKAQIQAIGAEDANAIRKISTKRGPDEFQKIAQISEVTREKLGKVLSEEQKAKLKELTGR